MDQLLVKNISKGCLKSYKVIFEKYYTMLYAYSNRLIHDPESAKEIVNDTFLKLWEHRKTLNREVDSIKPYLFQIAHNQCINHLKQASNKLKLEYLDGNVAAGYEITELEYEELQNAINQAIEALPTQRKQIFLMSRNEGLKYSEIAQQLGISPRTVETQIRRSLNYLREKINRFT
ncbi:DNA-directed RNA polymerase sigma-70 factor [Echinicola pacifica]|uniref:DNA-directed RNA polymerase sigma-70 factor n=1 Tax=Echinicola pacifica TaxID=346377 RepID=A0A918PWU0_9BACT|nr:RNA polymerase sigma-70 factor [Echinicola pacifica]GGZ25544.1 DNA-directed RNA polymerase sigma-70 factor [Echinicola pacifica]